MTISHLYGSLGKNITDIIKGGGCPEISAPNKRYSVLRYFSRMKDDTLPEIAGVVGDGGLYQYSTGYLPSGSDRTYMSQYYYCANLALSGGLPFFHSVVDFPAPNNVLNICNQRELTDPTGYYNGGWINDSASNSICNIELANDVIVRDGSGYYNYNLYKKAHTMDIIPAGESVAVSKTAELMEFVFLHAFVAKCRTGQLYIEIEDFEITGDTTVDHLVYVYYWETPTDKSSIANSFINDDSFLSSNQDLLTTDQDNTCVKVMKLSQLQGVGTDNKLIIWLNRLKTRQEKFAVNVLIGLKPQDLRRDCKQLTGASTYFGINYDEADDLVFKFKKASIKIKKMPTTFDCLPVPYPVWGFQNLESYSESYLQQGYIIRLAPCNSSNVATDWSTTTIDHFGVPNSGASYYPSWANLTFSSVANPQPYIRTQSGYLMEFTAQKFYKTTRTFNPSDTYILKLPCLTNCMSFKVIDVFGATAYSAPDTDYTINIYAGDAMYENVSGLPKALDFVNSLTLLHSFAVSDLCDALLTTPNSGSAYGVTGTPYTGYLEIYDKKNIYKYISFLGSALPAYNPLYFYIIIKKAGIDLNQSYGWDNGADLPSGYSDDDDYEECHLKVISEYSISNYITGASSSTYKNFDSILFKAPQIIAKSAQPTAENYFS